VNQEFTRHTFDAHRIAEFATRDGLQKQTGHTVEKWPLVVLKELIDNALDVTESIGFAPLIEVVVDTRKGTITVGDNGPGLDGDTIKRITDFALSVSDKRDYVSPSRGAQGNALATILAMPYVLTGKPGETVIESKGVRYVLTFDADPIIKVPRVAMRSELDDTKAGSVQSGTTVTAQLASVLVRDAKDDFVPFVRAFACLNPHASIFLTLDRKPMANLTAIDLRWHKWTPRDAIPAHWYDTDRFDQLVRANIAKNPGIMVRNFIEEFRGLKRTQKRAQILDHVGASRMTLARLYDNGNGDKAMAKLLRAMQRESSPVNPHDLGVIGENALRQRFAETDAEMETFQYRRKSSGKDSKVPWSVEVAFAWRGERFMHSETGDRELIAGLNFSPAIIDPFRHIGIIGGDNDISLADLLNARRAGPEEPVMMLVHLTCPLLTFTDRGKGTVVLGNRYVDSETQPGYEDLVEASAFDHQMGLALREAVEEATEKWHKRRKAEERAGSTANRALHLLRSKLVSLKDACFQVMREAYRKVRSDGKGGVLPVNARQLCYEVRRLIQSKKLTDVTLTNDYFSQKILQQYQNEHGVLDIHYDDRGHFAEPHTGKYFGVGTNNVRNYIAALDNPKVVEASFAPAKVETNGPKGRFCGVLYIEKEGFDALLESVELVKRYDLALMSCKGLSVTAARELAEAVCHELGGVPLFALHDFDKTGFSIRSTLGRDTKRYKFTRKVNVIDLGLTLDDVRDLGLEDLTEKHDDKGTPEAREANLRLNGATDEEVEFLLERRVELNALSPRDFIAFVERKLKQHGVRKVVPADELLAKTYRAHVRSERVRAEVERIIATAATEDIPVPDNIREQVIDLIKRKHNMPWDEAVAEIVAEIMRESEKW
jgi:DNA topoisomerase VI subunit B